MIEITSMKTFNVKDVNPTLNLNLPIEENVDFIALLFIK